MAETLPILKRPPLDSSVCSYALNIQRDINPEKLGLVIDELEQKINQCSQQGILLPEGITLGAIQTLRNNLSTHKNLSIIADDITTIIRTYESGENAGKHLTGSITLKPQTWRT